MGPEDRESGRDSPAERSPRHPRANRQRAPLPWVSKTYSLEPFAVYSGDGRRRGRGRFHEPGLGEGPGGQEDPHRVLVQIGGGQGVEPPGVVSLPQQVGDGEDAPGAHVAVAVHPHARTGGRLPQAYEQPHVVQDVVVDDEAQHRVGLVRGEPHPRVGGPLDVVADDVHALRLHDADALAVVAVGIVIDVVDVVVVYLHVGGAVDGVVPANGDAPARPVDFVAQNLDVRRVLVDEHGFRRGGVGLPGIARDVREVVDGVLVDEDVIAGLDVDPVLPGRMQPVLLDEDDGGSTAVWLALHPVTRDVVDVVLHDEDVAGYAAHRHAMRVCVRLGEVVDFIVVDEDEVRVAGDDATACPASVKHRGWELGAQGVRLEEGGERRPALDVHL